MGMAPPSAACRIAPLCLAASYGNSLPEHHRWRKLCPDDVDLKSIPGGPAYRSTLEPSRDERTEVGGVGALAHAVRFGLKLADADPALPPGDLFDAGDLEPLPLFDGLDELAGFHEAAVGARIEPGDAAAQQLFSSCAIETTSGP